MLIGLAMTAGRASVRCAWHCALMRKEECCCGGYRPDASVRYSPHSRLHDGLNIANGVPKLSARHGKPNPVAAPEPAGRFEAYPVKPTGATSGVKRNPERTPSMGRDPHSKTAVAQRSFKRTVATDGALRV